MKMNVKAPGRRALLAAGFAAAALAGGYYFYRQRSADAADEFASLARDIDRVSLLRADGETITWGELKGRPRAVFFGFTHCPVICPVTIYELTASLDRIGAGQDAVAIEFISVDPERDTPERLQSYFQGFGPRVHAFTGSAETVAHVAASFQVVYRRTPVEGGDYTIDHTATVFLLNAAGRVVDVVAYGADPALMDERLRALAGL